MPERGPPAGIDSAAGIIAAAPRNRKRQKTFCRTTHAVG